MIVLAHCLICLIIQIESYTLYFAKLRVVVFSLFSVQQNLPSLKESITHTHTHRKAKRWTVAESNDLDCQRPDLVHLSAP